MERRHNTRHAAALAAAKDAEVRTSDGEDPEQRRTSPGRSDMYDAFQNWALKTYGDSAKTKTVTRRKYNRITKILKGEEQTSAENSKFRFWVKAKGFRIGPSQDDSKKDTHLYVPCSRIAPGGNGKEETVFKKVAVVENFFDIIYGVHVEMDGRGGKHAGQKRTYKAIAETYAFLPREAVTHFLMSCADCQKRMHLAGGDGVKGRHGNEEEEEVLADPPEIDYSLPITTTYLKHMRRLGYSEEYALNPDKEESSSNPDSEVSEGGATSQEGTCHSAECQTDDVGDDFVGPYDVDCGGRTTDCEGPLDMSGGQQENGQWSGSGDAEPINMSREDKSATGSHQDHAYDRIMSPFSGATSREAPATPDNLSAGTKDDDDDDDDDDADKIDPNQCDPERLKAFNMFVRLFVDENLDRMVPISKQPKEKIQAIIDSCTRQFPEFSDRARKRIRTYLKSCRRNKRTRDQCSWEGGRPTLPHLTSAQAEHILAGACENESQNAKRMRLGLKPISVSLDDVERQRQGNGTVVPSATESNSVASRVETKPVVTRTPMALSICPVVNGGSHYRTMAYPSLQSAAAAATFTAATCTNGPTDLSVKKERSAKYSLNPNEVSAVKQLIAGYRESAAFLLRSADELEQLLLQQN